MGREVIEESISNCRFIVPYGEQNADCGRFHTRKATLGSLIYVQLNRYNGVSPRKS